MKSFLSLTLILLICSCSPDALKSSKRETSSGKNSDAAAAKPFLPELLKKYQYSGDASQPYGLWTPDQVIVSEDGKFFLEVYQRYTKDSVAVIGACYTSQSKNYVLAATMLQIPAVKESDGQLSYDVKKFSEENVSNFGIDCSSYVNAGKFFIKLNEKGNLLLKDSNSQKFTELHRIK